MIDIIFKTMTEEYSERIKSEFSQQKSNLPLCELQETRGTGKGIKLGSCDINILYTVMI